MQVEGGAEHKLDQSLCYFCEKENISNFKTSKKWPSLG